MKRTFKRMLSLLFVLVMTLQLCGLTAAADGAVSIRTYERTDDGDLVDLDDGLSYAVYLGSDELSDSFSIEELSHEDLVVMPPVGYRIAGLTLTDGDGNEAHDPLPLTADDPNGSDATSVTIRHEDMIDGYGNLDYDLIPDGGALILTAVFEALDDSAEPEISVQNGGTQYGSAELDALGDEDGWEFGGWLLRYENGSCAELGMSASISPYANCSVSPIWIRLVTFSAVDQEAEAGAALSDALLDYTMTEAPGGVYAYDVRYEVLDEAGNPVEIGSTLQAGTYQIYVSHALLLDSDDEIAENAKAVLSSAPAALTVTAAEAAGGSVPGDNPGSESGGSEGGSGPDPIVETPSNGDHTHSHTGTVTKEPTCTEKGTKTFTCDCGDTYTEELDALGHDYELVETVEPTTEHEGYTLYRCSRCGEEKKEDVKEKLTPEHSHSYTESVTKEATCTEKGTKTFTCDCGDTYTQEIPALGHDFQLDSIVEPTTEHEGYTLYKCSRCGEEKKEDVKEKLTPKHSHSYTESVTKEATCTEKGTKTFTCDCGDTYTQEIPALGHDFQLDSIVEPTTEREGYTLYKCSRCSEEKKDNLKPKLTPTPLGAPKMSSSTWTKSDKSGLTVTVDYSFDKFTDLLLDQRVLKRNTDYSVKEGSTVVTLSPDVLETLSAGSHELEIKFTDASATATFTVSSRDLSFTGQNVEKSYDGKAFDLQTEYVGRARPQGLADGHKATVRLVLRQDGKDVSQATEIGDYEIVLTGFSVADASGKDVSSSYNYTGKLPQKLGTLSIKAKADSMIPVTVTAKSQTWVYDGKTHEAKEYTLSRDLLDGDTMTVSFDGASAITDAGTAANKISTVIIKDKSGANVSYAVNGKGSGKYDLSYVDGTLKVNPYALTLTAVSAEKVYDGTALRNDNVKASSLVSGQKFRSGDGVKFSVSDSRGNLIKNGPIEIGTYTKKVTEVHIVDAKGNDVTKNYDITKIDGMLTIKRGDPSTNTKSPRTGDENNVAVWIILLAIAAVAIAAVAYVLIKGKKTGNRKFWKK